MSRRLRSALLVFALLWQSISMVNPFAATERLDQFSHLLIQVKGVDHLHASLLGSLKFSAKLDQHLHAGESLSLAGLLLQLDLRIAVLPGGTPLAKSTRSYAAPSLDGLLRPPKAAA